MTENDYIAEYVKERFPRLLGIDYGAWKFMRQLSRVVCQVIFKDDKAEKLKEYITEREREETDKTDNGGEV